MTERTVDHIGIAVHSLDLAIPFWTSVLQTSAVQRLVLEDEGVEVAFIGSGSHRIELLAPLHDGSIVARFLDQDGPGIHHICVRVPDIGEAIAACITDGLEMVDPQPRLGAFNHLIAFIHPSSAEGVLTELLERTGEPAE